jgi:hypothetical protein
LAARFPPSPMIRSRMAGRRKLSATTCTSEIVSVIATYQGSNRRYGQTAQVQRPKDNAVARNSVTKIGV